MEKREIHWGDESGLCSDIYHWLSYAPLGQKLVIRLHLRCTSDNLISTVTNQGKNRFMVYTGKMKSDTFIKFMKRLVNGFKNKLS